MSRWAGTPTAVPTALPAQASVPPVPEGLPATSLAAPVRDEIDLIAESSAIRTLEEWTAPEPEAAHQPDPFAGGFPSFPDAIEEQEVPVGRSQQDQAMAEQILQVINVERAADGEQPLTTLDANTMELIRRTVAEQTQDGAARSVIFNQAAQAAVADARQTESELGRAQTAPAQPVSAPVTPAESVAPPVAAPEPVVVHTDPSDAPIEIDRLDLDQLTARLYDRLRARIRMELLIDRERAGLLTDFR